MFKRRLLTLFSIFIMVMYTLCAVTYAEDESDSSTVTISAEQASVQTKFVEQIKASAMTSSQGTYNKEVVIEGAEGSTYYVNDETFKIIKEKVVQYENSMQSNGDSSIEAAKERVKSMSNELNLGTDTDYTDYSILSDKGIAIEAAAYTAGVGITVIILVVVITLICMAILAVGIGIGMYITKKKGEEKKQ